MNTSPFVLAVLVLAACTTTPEGTPDVITTTGNACKANTAAIRATDAAIKSNTLKGSAAREAVAALAAAQASCNAALQAVRAAQPASAPQ